MTKRLLLTTITFVIAQLFLMLVLDFSNISYFDSDSWVRWDSGHYLKIASEGYNFFPCAGKFGYPEDATEMCGNTGWFPAYPFLIKLLSYLFSDTAILAGYISKLFYILSLFMVTVISKIEKISLKNILFLLLAAFFFGFIYYHAVFPISMLLFFSLLGFYFFIKERLWLSSACCSIAALTYPTGFLLSFVFAFSFLIGIIREARYKELLKCFIPLIGGGLGVGLAFLIFHLQVGEWSAFIQVQSKYDHGFHNPIENIKSLFSTFAYSSLSLNRFIELQSILVIVGFLLLTLFFFVKKLYTNQLYLISYLYLCLFLIFPWAVGGNLSMYRAESLLLPSVLLLKELKMSSTILLLFTFIGIGGVMSHLFFSLVLI